MFTLSVLGRDKGNTELPRALRSHDHFEASHWSTLLPYHMVVVGGPFLAALSSSRRLVVCWSVRPLVRPLVGWSEDLCEKVTFRIK